MTRGRLRVVAALMPLLATAPSAAGESGRGFDFCAPPLWPACVDAPEATAACDSEVQRFIATVFKYRACLEKESERAVREANDAIEAWKCRTGKLKCR